MIRGLARTWRFAIAGAWLAWVVDRALRWRGGGTPPPAIRSLIVIDAPIDRVWPVLSDIEGQPRWMHDMKSVSMTTPGPTRVGSTGWSTVRMLGISVTDPVTVTEIVPPKRFAISHDGTFTGGGILTLEPGADGSTTIVRWDETLIAPILPYVAALAMAPVFRHVFQRDLERLRNLVESGTV